MLGWSHSVEQSKDCVVLCDDGGCVLMCESLLLLATTESVCCRLLSRDASESAGVGVVSVSNYTRK